jgi:type IV pilus assembly protein PilM
MRRLAGKLALPFRRQGRFLAIDFDSRQVRVVQAELTLGGVRVLKLAATEVPEGVDTTDPVALGGLLRQTLERMHVRGQGALMCVPRGQVVLKPLFLPRASNPGELAGMVQYQAEKELSFRPQEAVVDFTLESHYGAERPPEEQAEGQQVLVAAVRQPVVDYYRAVAHAAGLKLVGLGLRPYANLRCAETYAGCGAESRVAVVHITADESEIDVFDAGGVAFTRPAVIKIPRPGTEPAVGDAAQMVVTEVTRSLHSYLGVEREHKIDKVLVAGGTGIEPRVAAELHRRLGISAEALDPGPTLGVTEGSTPASAFISALGLAVGHSPQVGMAIDFLNPKRAPVQRDMRKLKVIAAAVSLAVIVGGVFAASAVYYLNERAGRDALQEQYNKLKLDNRRVDALAKHISDIDRWTNGGRNWLDQWAYLSGIFPPCTDTYVTSLNSTPDGSLKISVRATTSEALDELSKRLTGGGYGFKPGQVSTGSDTYNYKYMESVVVIVKPTMTVDLASLPEPVRPENDNSAEILGRSPPPVRQAGSTLPPAKAAATAPAAKSASPAYVRPSLPSSGGGASPTSTIRMKGSFGGGRGGGGGGSRFIEPGLPEGGRHE